VLRNKLNSDGEDIFCKNKAKNTGIAKAMASIFNLPCRQAGEVSVKNIE